MRSSTSFGPGNQAALRHGARSPKLVRLNMKKTGGGLRKELESKSRRPLVRLAIDVISRRQMVSRWLDGRKGQAARSLDVYLKLAAMEAGLLDRLGCGQRVEVEVDPEAVSARLRAKHGGSE